MLCGECLCTPHDQQLAPQLLVLVAAVVLADFQPRKIDADDLTDNWQHCLQENDSTHFGILSFFSCNHRRQCR